MISKELMDKIEIFAKNNMVDDFLHGWSHIERVIKYARQINDEINANWNITYVAVLLHDIGHKYGDGHHNVKGSEIAYGFLKEIGIKEEISENIKQCILTHSRQYSETKPTTLEAKVLFDADGMDLFGPIGLMRALLSCILNKKGFKCIMDKCEWRLQQRENFYSNKSKIFVRENSKIIESYLIELKNQLELFKD
ncbi:MAG: HD domain-containing protein [Promethearchaeota archaeon]|nr:MAG: HD domain-containing protein [Candidatus Lokiarchaeota archaeon]